MIKYRTSLSIIIKTYGTLFNFSQITLRCSSNCMRIIYFILYLTIPLILSAGNTYADMVYGVVKNHDIWNSDITFYYKGNIENGIKSHIDNNGNYSINLKEEGIYKIIHEKSKMVAWVRSSSTPTRSDLNFKKEAENVK